MTFPDRLLYVAPRRQATDNSRERFFVFFITGNPGVIAYYESFLSTLASLLSTSTTKQYLILGTSLAGFETGISRPEDAALNEDPPPYGLQRQIILAEERLRDFILGSEHEALKSAARGDDDGLRYRHLEPPKPKVILIGHSVGAYIVLELIRRSKNAASPIHELNIIGGVLLFPTVTHIAKSPSGVRLGVCHHLLLEPHQS